MIGNGVHFTVKAFVKRDAPPGHDVRYFEYLHRKAAEKKVEYFRDMGCPVMLMDKDYTVLEAY